MGILCITRKPGEAFTLSAEGVAPIRLHLDANGDIAAGHGALGDRPELYVGQHAVRFHATPMSERAYRVACDLPAAVQLLRDDAKVRGPRV